MQDLGLQGLELRGLVFKVQRVGLRVSGFRVKDQRLKRQTELKDKEGQLAAVINAHLIQVDASILAGPCF